MTRYRASIETLWTPEQAFAYLSDFSTSSEWDPGVVEAARVGAGAVGAEPSFALWRSSWGARHQSLTASSSVTRRTRSRSWGRPPPPSPATASRSSGSPPEPGSPTTLPKLKGLLRLADPLLALAFNRVGDRALVGLREVLARPADEMVDAAA